MSDTAHDVASLTTPGDARKDFQPGQALRKAVRAAFIQRTDPPTTLHEWCRTQKPPVAWSTANAALLGVYDSDEIRALRDRILRACGLVEGDLK